jgi:hypothetical protein
VKREIHRPSKLWLRRRELAGGYGVEKPGGFVRTVAERLVRGMAATAEGDGCAARETEGPTLGIEDFKIAFDADGPVGVYGDFGCSHFLS